MSNLQCNKCQNHMRLQSESLTEEFWVCTNTDCNKWLRRSTVIHDSKEASTPLFGGLASRFSTKVFARLR